MLRAFGAGLGTIPTDDKAVPSPALPVLSADSPVLSPGPSHSCRLGAALKTGNSIYPARSAFRNVGAENENGRPAWKRSKNPACRPMPGNVPGKLRCLKSKGRAALPRGLGRAAARPYRSR